MSCLIIGDSIAYGVSQVRPDCQAYAQSGISTLGWSKKWLDKIDLVADVVMISLGSNDIHNRVDDVLEEMYAIREKIGMGKKVIWVLPAIKPWVQDCVDEVAYEFGDTVLEIKILSKDKVHPTYSGYKALGQEIK